MPKITKKSSEKVVETQGKKFDDSEPRIYENLFNFEYFIFNILSGIRAKNE